MCKFNCTGRVSVSRRIWQQCPDNDIQQWLNTQNLFIQSDKSAFERMVNVILTPFGKMMITTECFRGCRGCDDTDALTTIYFEDEADDCRRGYFTWSPGCRVRSPLQLGKVIATNAVSDLLSASTIHRLIEKQLNYDWGEVSQYDWLLNDDAARQHGNVVAMHHVEGEKVFMVTEPSNHLTTILFGYEY
ncbi:hypothetical protein RYD26_05165 [Pasteurellaceae bacterium LIM206]|nr:hypothetical protein [Pasteurellaceae bacterium LIM206]